ncbi:MAG: putative quinol monooxygenase, partial [Pseudomonadota bacterium]
LGFSENYPLEEEETMLAVVAQIKVKPGAEAEFEKVAAELVAASRQEEGCLEYTLWRTAETGLYAFTEKYRDADAVDAHRKSEHFRSIGKAMGAFMDGPPNVLRLSAI